MGQIVLERDCPRCGCGGLPGQLVLNLEYGMIIYNSGTLDYWFDEQHPFTSFDSLGQLRVTLDPKSAGYYEYTSTSGAIRDITFNTGDEYIRVRTNYTTTVPALYSQTFSTLPSGFCATGAISITHTPNTSSEWLQLRIPPTFSWYCSGNNHVLSETPNSRTLFISSATETVWGDGGNAGSADVRCTTGYGIGMNDFGWRCLNPCYSGSHTVSKTSGVAGCGNDYGDYRSSRFTCSFRRAVRGTVTLVPQSNVMMSAPPSEPTILQKAVHYSQAVTSHLANGMKVKSDEEVLERLNICKSCEHYNADKSICRICGCHLSTSSNAFTNKIRMASERCPQSKW